jgi:glutamate formiminotransferase / 5-formyltetrahydrofolate cyclo-ligase
VSLPLLQCVPNVSEGRDTTVIDTLGRAIDATAARLVDVHRDSDHHRSVFTFLGPVRDVEDGAVALTRAAIRLVDLTKHRGVHPRVGAVDVIPFVPMRGASMADAVAAAHRVGRTVAAACGVPVFFYGEAARGPLRRELPILRRGGFEGLATRLADPAWRPDEGSAAPHPTAGVTVIGARGPLIAFNAVLDSADVDVAAGIARVLRESSGGLPAVRAMGVLLQSRGRAQVSMNLLEYRRTAVALVAQRLQDEARRRGSHVVEYELVGCAPADALDDWPPELAPIAGLKPSQLLDPSLFPG